jgi:hypothetical protein
VSRKAAEGSRKVGGSPRTQAYTGGVGPQRAQWRTISGRKMRPATTYPPFPVSSVQHCPLAFLGDELLDKGHYLVAPQHDRLDFGLCELGFGLLQDLVAIQLA